MNTHTICVLVSTSYNSFKRKNNEDWARKYRAQDNLELSKGDLGGDSIRCRKEKCGRVATTTLAHIGSTMVHSAMRQ